MKKETERSPLVRAMPLRVAGQSLDAEIDDVQYDHVLSPLFLALFMIVFACFEWARYLLNMNPSPLAVTGGALLACVYAAVRIKLVRRRLKQLKTGRDGERAVAQYLEC